MIQGTLSKPEDAEKVEHLEFDPPELVDNTAYLSDLNEKY